MGVGLDYHLAPMNTAKLTRIYGPGSERFVQSDLARSRLAQILFSAQAAAESYCIGRHSGWELLWRRVLRETHRCVAGARGLDHLLPRIEEALTALDAIDIGSCLYEETVPALEGMVSCVGPGNVLLFTQGCPRHQLSKVQGSDVLGIIGRSESEFDTIGGDKYLTLCRINAAVSGRTLFIVDDSPSVHEKVAAALPPEAHWLSLCVRTGHQRGIDGPMLGGSSRVLDSVRRRLDSMNISQEEYAPRITLSHAQAVLSWLSEMRRNPRVLLDCDGTLWNNGRMRVLQAEALLPFIIRAIRV